MREFPHRKYFREVIQPYATAGSPDPFERYLLDLDDADDDAIFDRLEQVKAFWNDNRALPPPIGPLIVRMLGAHSQLECQLGDPSLRRPLADEIRSPRARAEA